MLWKRHARKHRQKQTARICHLPIDCRSLSQMSIGASHLCKLCQFVVLVRIPVLIPAPLDRCSWSRTLVERAFCFVFHACIDWIVRRQAALHSLLADRIIVRAVVGLDSRVVYSNPVQPHQSPTRARIATNHCFETFHHVMSLRMRNTAMKLVNETRLSKDSRSVVVLIPI